jgi:hypothetical protein
MHHVNLRKQILQLLNNSVVQLQPSTYAFGKYLLICGAAAALNLQQQQFHLHCAFFP